VSRVRTCKAGGLEETAITCAEVSPEVESNFLESGEKASVVTNTACACRMRPTLIMPRVRCTDTSPSDDPEARTSPLGDSASAVILPALCATAGLAAFKVGSH